MRIIALDPSLTSTGAAFGLATEDEPTTLRTFSSIKGDHHVSQRISRFIVIAEEIAAWCAGFEPTCIAIEGYAYSMGNSAWHSLLLEFGAMLRRALLEQCADARIYEINPTNVKTFACGKSPRGKKAKTYLADAIRSRFGRTFGTTDEMDAWIMWRMARMLEGFDEPAMPFEARAIGLEQGTVKAKPRPARRGRKKATKGSAKQGKLAFE